MNAALFIYRADVITFFPPFTEHEKADFIIEVCARHCGADKELVTKKGKKREVMNAKHLSRFFIHNFTTITLESNAHKTGAEDHSSTINSFRVVSDLCDTEKEFRLMFEGVEKEISSRLSRVEPIVKRPSVY